MRHATGTAARRLLRIAVLVPILALGGCETINTIIAGPAPPPPCPRVAKVEDAETLTRFQGTGRDLTDVQFEAEIGRIAAGCDYDSDKIDMVVDVEFIASRGPADQERKAAFTYFVAVARTDDTILGRATFESVIEFPGNQTRTPIVEELEQEIPRKEGEPGRNFIVYIGFALTEDELAFNRQQRP